MKTKNLILALGILVAANSANALSEDAEKEHAKKEKCYGISKAGKNDCTAADGSHSCAGYAKSDASGKDWVLLPEGTCERIVGSSNKPVLEKN